MGRPIAVRPIFKHNTNFNFSFSCVIISFFSNVLFFFKKGEGADAWLAPFLPVPVTMVPNPIISN
jgi:hypothetical protein